MSEDKPIVYILHGDDREAIETHIRRFYESLEPPDMANMNTTRLEGKSTTLNDFRAAALAVPFLTERRLVIIEDALKPYQGTGKQKVRQDFLSLLETLPASTALVLVLPDSRKYDSGPWETFNDKHWFIKWATTAGLRVWMQDCGLPYGNKMKDWIREKVAALGGEITPLAVDTLVEYVGNNTQRAAREIEKLLTYVNFERPVDGDDVEALTYQDRQRDIFTLVDAIGNRDGQKAQEMLHLLLEENDPLQIFGMIIRQFRLILQAQEIIDTGGNAPEVAKVLKIHSFVAGKITAQTRQFDLSMLESIYQQLLAIDYGSKSGGMARDIAMDVLIARLAEGENF